MNSIMKSKCLLLLSVTCSLAGCVSDTYSPMYVDYPKLSIADITASYDKATVKFSPLNAGTLSYAVVEDSEVEPSMEDYITVETSGGDHNIVVADLKPITKYRVYAYATSNVYEGEVSLPTSGRFSTQELVSLNETEETANCYIIPREGCFKFNATVKGNGNEPVGDAVTAEVVWSDVANLLANIEVMKDGWVTFVAKQDIGNCVLAVKDANGKILWSWHIWGTGGIPSDDVFVNAAGTSYNVMDRFLGAYSSSSGTTCVLYQWGRKDPFANGHFVYVGNKTTTDRMNEYWKPVKWNQTGDESGNNILYTIENPAVMIDNTDNANQSGNWTWRDDWSLWGDKNGHGSEFSAGGWSEEKSMYDPCPNNYRVANVNTFSGVSLSSAVGGWSNGYWIKRNTDDIVGAWFPATSSRNAVTGKVERGALCEFWYSNASGSTATAKPRMFGAHSTSIGPSGTAVPAIAHAVRCVRYKSN